MKLYDYQARCLRALAADFKQGHKSLLVQAATGVGKCVMLLAWLDSILKPGERALIVAHRGELVTQPLEKARRFFPDLARDMGIVMNTTNDAGARVVVATVQTLNSAGRLDELLSHGAFNYYVVDEAHHDALGVSTYRFVEDTLRKANPGLLKTGWTATPTRTDENGLITVDGKQGTYDKMSFRYPVQTAIRENSLCSFSAYAAGVPVSVAAIAATRDGWDNIALGDILNAENVWEVVLDAWRGKIKGLPDCSSHPTIVFTASVKQAHGGAEFFRRHGIVAESVDGTTPKDERAEILKRFQSGKTRAVFNCQVLTEGFDAPNASCALMVAPTKSALVWTQKAGRTLRLDPGNPDKRAVLIDFYPIERGNVFAADALGVPQAIKKAKQKAEEAGIPIGGWNVNQFGRATAIDTDRIVVRTLDLLSRSRHPWTLNGHMATTALSKTSAACIVLPDSATVEKAERMRTDGKWSEKHERLYNFVSSVRLYNVQKHGYQWKAELVNTFDDPETAKLHVDEWPSDVLGARSAGWRKKKISPQQMKYMSTLGVDYDVDMEMGEASRLISETLTLQATEKAEEYERQRIWRPVA